MSLSAARFDVFEPVVAFAFFVFAVCSFSTDFDGPWHTVCGQLLSATDSKPLIFGKPGRLGLVRTSAMTRLPSTWDVGDATQRICRSKC